MQAQLLRAPAAPRPVCSMARTTGMNNNSSRRPAAVVSRRVGGACVPRLTLWGSRGGAVPVVASTLAPRSPNSNEEGFGAQERGQFSPQMGVPNVTMAGGGNFGSGGSLGATLERSKLSFVMPTPVVQGPKLDDGGSGGDIGKINRNGGGGGGGGDDDDDEYFGEDDGDGDGDGEGGQGVGLFRAAIPECYDKFSIGAVLAEWMKTVQDLPAILRQAVTMGLFSSAQLVRFFSMDVRPSVTRAISRRLPPSVARDFIGRLMADPGFVQKLVLESAFASAASLWYEYRLRGEKFKQEADLVLINTLGFAAATAATVWLLAPSRSYGTIQKFPWQQMLDGLPNCVFDASGPLRQYSKGARAAGFVAKMAELSAVGALMGTVTSLAAGLAVGVRQRSDPEWRPSTDVPSAGRSSAGLAAFFALNANTRYQLLGGLDHFLFSRTTFLWTYVALNGAARIASNQAGELSRAWWQGLPAPSTLAPGPSLPAPMLPRRVKKKVSKRVPRSKAATATAAQGEAAGAALAATAAMGAITTPTLSDVVVPLETTLVPAQQAADASPVELRPDSDAVLQTPVPGASDQQAQAKAPAAAGWGDSGPQPAVAAVASGATQAWPQPPAASYGGTASEEDDDEDDDGSERSSEALPERSAYHAGQSFAARH